MVIEPRLLRTLAVTLLSVPGQGDEYDVLENGLLKNLVRYFSVTHNGTVSKARWALGLRATDGKQSLKG